MLIERHVTEVQQGTPTTFVSTEALQSAYSTYQARAQEQQTIKELKTGVMVAVDVPVVLAGSISFILGTVTLNPALVALGAKLFFGGFLGLGMVMGQYAVDEVGQNRLKRKAAKAEKLIEKREQEDRTRRIAVS